MSSDGDLPSVVQQPRASSRLPQPPPRRLAPTRNAQCTLRSIWSWNAFFLCRASTWTQEQLGTERADHRRRKRGRSNRRRGSTPRGKCLAGAANHSHFEVGSPFSRLVAVVVLHCVVDERRNAEASAAWRSLVGEARVGLTCGGEERSSSHCSISTERALPRLEHGSWSRLHVNCG